MPSLTVSDVLSGHHRDKKEVKVTYTSHKDFEVQAKKLKIMFDFRVTADSGVFPPSQFPCFSLLGRSAPHSLQGGSKHHVQRSKSSPYSSTTLERL